MPTKQGALSDAASNALVAAAMEKAAANRAAQAARHDARDKAMVAAALRVNRILGSA
jgi:hypothetical protein